MDDLRTIALCWRIERVDGVAVGLTSHDRDIVIDGLVHRAAPGMVPSAVVRGGGLDADTMDVAGALTSAAVTERDLIAGRWDGARVALVAVDWTSGAVVARLGEGRIGDVEIKQGGFTAELTGAAAALARPVVEETSATCRAVLGDGRCRVPMAARRRFARVTAAAGVEVTVDAVEPGAGAYAGGVVRWFAGANGGMESAIAASAGQVLTLYRVPAFAVEAGTLVELVEGCDKTIATCGARFGNAAHFRGEPYLPGIDLLTRYPGE